MWETNLPPSKERGGKFGRVCITRGITNIQIQMKEYASVHRQSKTGKKLKAGRKRTEPFEPEELAMSIISAATS